MRAELEETKAAIVKGLALPPPTPRFDPHFVRNRDVMLRFLEGQSIPEIAFDLRLEEKQVKAILRKSPIKQEVNRLAGLANDRYVQERIDTLSIEALDVVRDTMRGQQFNELRFKAAKQVLDLNPLLKANPKSDLEQIAAGLGESIITRLAKMEADAAQQKAEVDVTPETPAGAEEDAEDNPDTRVSVPK